MDFELKPTNYFVTHGWMITNLHLKGAELSIYAIIYGFTQTDDQWFTGSLNYLAAWINSTKRTVISSLQALEEKGFIEKETYAINGVKFCKYRASNFIGGEIFSPPRENFSPNNIDNNDTYKYVSYSREGQQKKEQFKKPTVEDIAEYCRERNNGIDAQRFFDYYEAKGWLIGKTKMKDWRAAVRTWERGSNAGAGTATRGEKINYEAEMTEREREWLKGLDRDED